MRDAIGRETVWNVQFSRLDLDQSVATACEALEGSQVVSVAFVNPHSQVVASEDADFAKALTSFSLILADGVGTILAARLLGKALPGRVPGPIFFAELSKTLNVTRAGTRYFFLGSTPDVLEAIRKRMLVEYPQLVVAGTYSPPMGEFSDSACSEMIDAVNAARADVLWVGLTAPKQEKWIAKWGAQTGVKIAAGIGAEFDYFAEAKRRPPSWVSKLGLQWFHRFLQEPRRTWRRHFVSAPIFLWRAVLTRSK